MAYRIRYDNALSARKATDAFGREQLLCAFILFGVILLGSVYSAAVKKEISAVFLPGRIEKIAWDYADGKSARQILIGQCRQILVEYE